MTQNWVENVKNDTWSYLVNLIWLTSDVVTLFSFSLSSTLDSSVTDFDSLICRTWTFSLVSLVSTMVDGFCCGFSLLFSTFSAWWRFNDADDQKLDAAKCTQPFRVLLIFSLLLLSFARLDLTVVVVASCKPGEDGCPNVAPLLGSLCKLACRASTELPLAPTASKQLGMDPSLSWYYNTICQFTFTIF